MSFRRSNSFLFDNLLFNSHNEKKNWRIYRRLLWRDLYNYRTNILSVFHYIIFFHYMKVTLIRHTTPDVPKGIFYGKTDVGVISSFEEEATMVKSSLSHKCFDSVFSSPRSRCLKLARFCGYPHAIIDEDLAEMDFGEWEMKRFDEITDKNLEDYFKDWKNTVPPGGESFMNHSHRVKRFINSCFEKGLESILVFTHGGTIMHFKILSGMINDSRPFDHIPLFGGIVEIEINHPIE